VVDDALAPDPAEGRIVHPGEDRRVLHRDGRLVVVAVQRPGPDLVPRQLAVVQEAVERVEVVVAARADAAQLRFQLPRRIGEPS
jgi:hypothetical protein